MADIDEGTDSTGVVARRIPDGAFAAKLAG
jgi:hypothetical protein